MQLKNIIAFEIYIIKLRTIEKFYKFFEKRKILNTARAVKQLFRPSSALKNQNIVSFDVSSS